MEVAVADLLALDRSQTDVVSLQLTVAETGLEEPYVSIVVSTLKRNSTAVEMEVLPTGLRAWQDRTFRLECLRKILESRDEDFHLAELGVVFEFLSKC